MYNNNFNNKELFAGYKHSPKNLIPKRIKKEGTAIFDANFSGKSSVNLIEKYFAIYLNIKYAINTVLNTETTVITYGESMVTMLK